MGYCRQTEKEDKVQITCGIARKGEVLKQFEGLGGLNNADVRKERVPLL